MAYPFDPFGTTRGYSPMNSGGQPYRPYDPWSGMPGGIVGNLAGQAILNPMMEQVGMLPTGMPSNQNMYDRLQMQRLTDMNKQVLQQAAKAERGRIAAGIKGAHALTGRAWDADAQAFANKATDFLVDHADEAIMIPGAADFMDQMGGRAGSSTAMGLGVIKGGRFRLDPVTGKSGMSANSMGQLSQSLYKGLYESGNIEEMRGFKAGQMGDAFDELTRRGLMAGPGNADERQRGALVHMARTDEERFKRAADAAGVSNKDVTRLTDAEVGRLTKQDDIKAAMGDSTFMRDVDTERIKGTLKKYTGALAAMRDIFGDAGKQNSTMGELINGLQQLTNGSLSQLPPGQVEKMVRTLSNVAKNSGVGMEGAMFLMSHASQQANGLGLNQAFTTDMVTGAMAFRQAHGESGMGSANMWGLSDVDKLMQRDINLRAGALDSPLANQMAVGMRIADTLGAGTFKEGSQAAQYIQAIKIGKNKMANGQSINMEEDEFVKMLVRDSGGTISESQARGMIESRQVNQEYISKHGIGEQVRRMQGTEDVQPFMQESMSAAIGGQMRDLGIDNDVAATAAAKAATDSLGKMSATQMANPRIRAARMGAAMEAELSKDPKMKAKLDELAKTPGAKERFLAGMAENAWGTADSEMQSEFHTSAADALATTNSATMERTSEGIAKATVQGMMQSAMSGVGVGTIISKVTEALQSGDLENDPEALTKVLTSALGTDKKEVAEKFVAGMTSIARAGREEKAAHDKYEEDAAAAYARGDVAAGDKIDKDYKSQAEIRAAKVNEMRQEAVKFAEEHNLLDPLAKEGAKQGVQPTNADTSKPQAIKLSGELTIKNADGSTSVATIQASGQSDRDGAGTTP